MERGRKSEVEGYSESEAIEIAKLIFDEAEQRGISLEELRIRYSLVVLSQRAIRKQGGEIVSIYANGDHIPLIEGNEEYIMNPTRIIKALTPKK